MVLTNAQIQNFFEHNANMAFEVDTINQLTFEGINNPSDLADFDKETMKQVADNMRNPGGRIPSPDVNAPAG